MHAAVLRYFDQVVRHGSIRKAAEAAHVAPSAIDRQLLRLERDLGAPLFERLHRGMALTPAGELLWQHVRETMTEFQRVRAEIASLQGALSGSVRVVSVESLMVVVLADLVADIGTAHPHIRFAVDAADPARIVETLRAGQADFGIAWIDRRERGFEIVREVPANLGAVMRPDHPLAGRAALTFNDCAAWPVVMMPNLWALSASSELVFSRSGARFRSRVDSNSFAFTRRMMKQGMGIGIFLPFGFLADIARGDFVHVPFAEPTLADSHIGLVKPRGRRLSPAARLVLERVADLLAALAAGFPRPLRLAGAAVQNGQGGAGVAPRPVSPTARKRAAVLALLDQATPPSDRAIARQTGVSPQTVGNLRRTLSASAPGSRLSR